MRYNGSCEICVLRKRTRGERFVYVLSLEYCSCRLIYWLAVTLEGTIIHKSGLITGGRSSHGNNKKWDEKDVQGRLIDHFPSISHGSPSTGLTRARDTLLAEQRELHQQRARGKSDENLISEISRLESLMIVAKDDLVCLLHFN